LALSGRRFKFGAMACCDGPAAKMPPLEAAQRYF
jgi:hypothetical protein